MENLIEIYQPMPDNMIQVHISDGIKKLEIFANYKNEKRFSVVLTNSEANWLASELKSPFNHWKRLENEQILRVVINDEIRQIIVSDIKNGKEVMAQLGVILDDVLGKVIDALKI